MDYHTLEPEFQQFQQEFPDFTTFFIIDGSGKLLFASDTAFIKPEDAPALIEAWKNHGSAFMIGDNRYPILSWEELQFAARNIKNRDAIVGTITQSKVYLLGRLKAGAGLSPAIAGIQLNRKFWKLI